MPLGDSALATRSAVLAEGALDVERPTARRRCCRRPRRGGTRGPACRTSRAPAARPRSSAGRLMPGSMVRATVETATQGRRSSGVATQRRLADQADGPPLPVTVIRLPASASRARRTASAGAGRRARPARGGPAGAPPGRAGCCGPGRTDSADGGGGPQEQRHHAGEQHVEDVGRRAEERLLEQRPGERGDGGHATGPGGDDGALEHVAGGTPDDRLEHPPAVERQARDQVEHADDEVGAGETLDGHQQQAVGRHEPQRRARPRPTAIEVERPHDRDHQLLARRARLAVDGGGPAEEVQGDRA